MQRRLIFSVVIVLLILLGIASTGWWLLHDPVAKLQPSVPGMDTTAARAAEKREVVRIGESFSSFGTTPDLPGTNWQRFRGPDMDNISKERIPLIEKWGNIQERTLWKVNLGEGHAAPAVFAGRVYLLDYDELKKCDALRCFALATGKELWRRSYKVHLKRNHGLSRTIPAVNEKYVVTIGPKCQVMCVDRITGDLKWGIDLETEYGTEVPFWYTGQCPLLDGDTAVIAPGGRALVAGLDCRTGKPVWEVPNPHKWKMSHSSVMKATVEGKKMYIYFAIGGICGISSSGPDAGKELWEIAGFAPAVVAPSPLVLEGGRILLTAGYGAGSAMIRVSRKGSGWSAEILQHYKPSEGISTEQQTPVFYKGTVFAILPNDAGGRRNQFIAVSPTDGTKILMTSGKNERYGLGPYIVADDKFFILDDDGELTIARASASGFTILDKARILVGQDAWGPVAITGGYLLARDSKQLVCLDIRKNEK
jgi:outer membrane protein assembly factor BamB